MRRKMWLQNMKIKLIVLGILIALILIIVLSVCGGFNCWWVLTHAPLIISSSWWVLEFLLQLQVAGPLTIFWFSLPLFDKVYCKTMYSLWQILSCLVFLTCWMSLFPLLLRITLKLSRGPEMENCILVWFIPDLFSGARIHFIVLIVLWVLIMAILCHAFYQHIFVLWDGAAFLSYWPIQQTTGNLKKGEKGIKKENNEDFEAIYHLKFLLLFHSCL